MTDSFPYRLTRLGVVMSPVPGDRGEVEGVLNPGSGTAADGSVYLLPRLVAEGNVSSIGLARVVVEAGVPVAVEREGVVLRPERTWERGAQNAGVEDPRVTRIEAIRLHVMTYVAFGPLGPYTAIAVSEDLRDWTRLGPVTFDFDDGLDVDLGLFHNKDTVFFPTPVHDPNGVVSLAVLHRPAWDLSDIRPGERPPLPGWLPDERPSIWIGFVPLADVQHDVRALTRWQHNRFLAGPEFDFEALKIGSGPAPYRVPEGWLLIHHGVTGRIERSIAPQQNVNYAAGAMILDADEPWRVLRRTSTPLMTAETDDERAGTVPNVVFPTAIEEIDGTPFVFYGMADAKIGVARLERVATSS
ncbi:glycosidase [Agromyces mediolanus]|uniref:glycoside hydrolase family 130 protein n=1 Tax=Agromyces mediolanus TaxID=41986 RepID=UPI00203B7AFC|nr:glycosidase [Agromyces mediolanus]MCM3658178.1 glycosidase [Agromyces mediolanus]